MKLRTDWHLPAAVRFADEPWVPSPEPAVERKRLDREGDEVARATSIVRYAAGASFAPHIHPLGEELLVLEGVFQDEHGDAPHGTYVRNPPLSRHRPFSREGCVIFVKLRQFQPGDHAHVVVPRPRGAFEGVRRTELHRFDAEEVAFVEMAAGATHVLRARAEGLELLMLDGALRVEGWELTRWDWLRLPSCEVTLAAHEPTALWVKTGHLGQNSRHSSK